MRYFTHELFVHDGSNMEQHCASFSCKHIAVVAAKAIALQDAKNWYTLHYDNLIEPYWDSRKD